MDIITGWLPWARCRREQHARAAAEVAEEAERRAARRRLLELAHHDPAAAPPPPGAGVPHRQQWRVTRAVDRTEHTAEHPSWDCRACGQPWPCGSARERLLVEFRAWPSALTIYLNAHLAAAYDDIPGITPGQLQERFLAWTRSPGQ